MAAKWNFLCEESPDGGFEWKLTVGSFAAEGWGPSHRKCLRIAKRAFKGHAKLARKLGQVFP